MSFFRNLITLPGRFVRGAWRFVNPKLKVGRIPYARTTLVIQFIAAMVFVGYTLVPAFPSSSAMATELIPLAMEPPI